MNRKKYLIITLDTEGDDLWSYQDGMAITTNNAKYCERFQKLANEYGFLPTWLSNWEMIHDKYFTDTFLKYQQDNKCEIGMHLHAWNNPPHYALKPAQNPGQAYLVEYPKEVIREKIAEITNFFVKELGFQPLSHRAGRWAMNQDYFKLLHEFGYKVDCSYTPGINWNICPGFTEGSKGTDYSKEEMKLQSVEGILEVPVTTLNTHRYIKYGSRYPLVGFARSVLHSMKGNILWLRPNGKNLKEMKFLVDEYSKSENLNYLMFMIHSSELMPGGSPTFKDENSIERLYKDIDEIFKYIAGKGYEGTTLKEYSILAR